MSWKCKIFGHKWKAVFNGQDEYIKDVCVVCQKEQIDKEKFPSLLVDAEDENGVKCKFYIKREKEIYETLMERGENQCYSIQVRKLGDLIPKYSKTIYPKNEQQR